MQDQHAVLYYSTIIGPLPRDAKTAVCADNLTSESQVYLPAPVEVFMHSVLFGGALAFRPCAVLEGVIRARGGEEECLLLTSRSRHI